MENICKNIITFFLKRNIIQDSDANACCMGLKLILSDIINFSIIILLGIFVEKPLYGVIYLCTFCGVRKFSGGFHAKTFFVCRMSMIGTFLTTIALFYLLSEFAKCISVLCVIFAIYTMLRFSPIIHPNRLLTKAEIKANKFVSVLSTCICSIISILLVSIEYNEGLYWALVLFAIAVLMYVGRIVNSRNETV